MIHVIAVDGTVTKYDEDAVSLERMQELLEKGYAAKVPGMTQYGGEKASYFVDEDARIKGKQLNKTAEEHDMYLCGPIVVLTGKSKKGWP